MEYSRNRKNFVINPIITTGGAVTAGNKPATLVVNIFTTVFAIKLIAR